MGEMSSVTKWPSVTKIRNLSSRFFIQSRVPPNILTDIGSIWIGLGSDINKWFKVGCTFKILCCRLGYLTFVPSTWRFDVSRKVCCLCRAISWYIQITGRTVTIALRSRSQAQGQGHRGYFSIKQNFSKQNTISFLGHQVSSMSKVRAKCIFGFEMSRRILERLPQHFFGVSCIQLTQSAITIEQANFLVFIFTRLK